MRNHYQKPQHEVFVKAMIEHDDPTKAYSIAYPNVSPASAQAAGSRLYARPDIRALITPALEEKYRAIHKEAMILAEEAGRLRAEEVCRKRRFLAMVVRCEVKKRKAYKTKEGLLIIHEDPSHDIILRAIELDLRLQDLHPRKDLIEKQFNRILRDLSPSPRHGILFTAEELMSEPRPTEPSGRAQIRLIRLNKIEVDEKTPLHRQLSITNSIEGKKPVRLENQANQINQSNLRFRQEEKTPLHRQLSITNSEPQIRLSKTEADEKTYQDRQHCITNSVGNEKAVTIENQGNQSNQTNLRFRQEEKTPLHRQLSITNSKPKVPTILKLKNNRSIRRQNKAHQSYTGHPIGKTG